MRQRCNKLAINERVATGKKRAGIVFFTGWGWRVDVLSMEPTYASLRSPPRCPAPVRVLTHRNAKYQSATPLITTRTITSVPRKSFMDLNRPYFWTATIHKWQKLMNDDHMKEIVIASVRPTPQCPVRRRCLFRPGACPHAPERITATPLITTRMITSASRKSFMDLNRPYFWTATIHKWQKLMNDDRMKEIVIESLRHLSNNKLIDVFGFVIMPNHMHMIWRLLRMNGKEKPVSSFLKHTAHQFQKRLRIEKGDIKVFKVDRSNKSYEFWQRDPVAFELNRRDTAAQKLDYIHANPLSRHWKLCEAPSEYRYSSAKFYETGEDGFGFLKSINEIDW
jgi:putative transposase